MTASWKVDVRRTGGVQRCSVDSGLLGGFFGCLAQDVVVGGVFLGLNSLCLT